MTTIFDNIVTKENDHTNLLRNIMERHTKVAAAVISYMLKRDVSQVEAASFEFSTQHSFLSESGREIPDILVRGPNFRCLIEAKIDPTLGLTDGQKRGYRGCFTDTGERHLCFLVPNEWKHAAGIDEVRTLLANAISVPPPSHWREVVRVLEEVSKTLADTILDEAISFWKWRFQFKPMTPQERDSLSIWPEERYSAVRKLEKTLDQAKGLFDARNFKTELETSDVYSYGFYIKREKSYILWVGIWTKAPAPLSFGFHSTKMDWLRPKELPLAPTVANDHHLWPLPSETWDDSEKLYAYVNDFLQSHVVD
jgi:hypothetical protein